MQKKLPIASIIIIAACALVGIAQLFLGDNFTYKLAMYEGAMKNGEYYRVITSAFIHYGFVHFGENMLCLFFLGQILEPKIGIPKFLIIYFFGAIGSSIAVELFGSLGADAWTLPMHGGASGAIWGLMGATFIYMKRNHYNIIGITRLIVINLIYTFAYHVSWQGHIGGFIAGTLVSLLVATDKNNTYRQWKKMHPDCDDSYFN